MVRGVRGTAVVGGWLGVIAMAKHEFDGSGVDLDGKHSWRCSCGWASAWFGSVEEAADALTAHLEDLTAHVVKTVTIYGRRLPVFVAQCSCGWRSAELSTSGMGASEAARHRDSVDR